MAPTVCDGPAKLVFSQSLNCVLVEVAGETVGPKQACAASADPCRIYSSLLGAGLAAAAGCARSGASGTSTPTKLESPGDSDRESSLEKSPQAHGRTPLRKKAAPFVPLPSAPPGLELAGPATAALGPDTLSSKIEQGAMTTLMVRNVPQSWSRAALTGLLDSKGFSGLYNFVYVPMNISTELNVGYAFVDVASPEVAKRFVEVFHGFDSCSPSSEKVWQVCLSEVQGLDANVRRYQNSPIMSEMVPEAYKPALFCDGVQVPFPAPTTKLRSLRLRVGKGKKKPEGTTAVA